LLEALRCKALRLRSGKEQEEGTHDTNN
jgi:hypothetical protein